MPDRNPGPACIDRGEHTSFTLFLPVHETRITLSRWLVYLSPFWDGAVVFTCCPNTVQSMMPSHLRLIPALVAAVALMAGGAARAGQIAFNFSSLNTSSTNAQISSLMSSQAGSAVTVTGAQVNTNYDGDDHVVGPTIGGTVVPWTLGDSGGTATNPTAPTSKTPTYSAYLATTGTITMNFSTPIYAVTFDFEIFPDASPPVPTFEFSATDSSNKVVAAQYQGNMTNLPWVVYSIAPGSNDAYLPGDPVTSTHSPNSGTGSTETSDQLIGEVTFVFSASDPATSLTFADWPQEIGINNLIINPNGVTPFTSVVPAPPSAVLLGFGALGLAGFVARSRRRLPAAA
jgi:MYXO-CTERM domain-containing protein